MTPYMNQSGQSGIAGFDLGSDSITVYFTDGGAYLYTYASTGAKEIEQMKALALAGQGLNSYISRVVQKRYARKL